MDRNKVEQELEDLEIRLKKDKQITFNHKMLNRNFIQRFLNIKPNMKFCDMCICQDRIFSTKMILNKYKTHE